MSAEDFIVALRWIGRRQPFRPFVVEFHSGDRLEVRHPEAVTVFETVAMYVSPQGAVRLFDGSSVCQLLVEPP